MKQMQSALFILLLGLAPIPVLAQVGSTVPNWTVPPYTSPRAQGGLTTMTDYAPPRVFVAVVPCRVADTRNAVGPYGGPALATNLARTFDIDAGPCGIAPGAEAYSLNFGAIIPPADGFLTAWPAGTAQPSVSQLNFLGGEVLANAAIVPASSNGAINVVVNIGPTHIYIDINGYFSSVVGGPLTVQTNTETASVNVLNTSSTCSSACGLNVTVAAGNAIRGHAGSATNAFYGVDGFSNSVHALAAGVRGLGAHKGIYGTGYGYFNAAGVFGNQYFGFPIALAAGYAGAGVRGEGVDTGVLGISRTQGVAGSLVDNAGTEISWGVVASNVGIDVAGPPWAFFGGGNIGATGTKYFLDPDPNDASRAIAYVSLEGPEAGTYFRGRARFQNGMARIPVPEHFRLVTDAEGLTVQITPIGEMATVAVVRMDLEEIVVKASRNVEFSYLVQGIRETHKHVAPFRDSSEFAPRAADSKIPDWLTAAQRRRLIQNGTYREDGTANTDTARRLGWDRIWEARSRPAREPGEP